MTINAHKTQFAGYSIQQWNDGPLTSGIAYRITTDQDNEEEWPDTLSRFVNTAGSDQVQAIVVGGAWDKYGDFEPVDMLIEVLIEHKDRLPQVHALFILDVTFEENEMSWIQQTDIEPLLTAYPQLTHLGTRGSDGLSIGHPRHERLQSLILESGGMPQKVLNELREAEFPALIDFELWTGSSGYGWESSLEDLLPFIHGEVFPNLKRLGICNCEITDEVVLELVKSPLMDQLEALDLSRGTLSDVGAKALLAHPAVRRLKSLDVRHHFCSVPIEAQLYGLMGDGVKVEIDTAQNERDWDDDGRYVAVGE